MINRWGAASEILRKPACCGQDLRIEHVFRIYESFERHIGFGDAAGWRLAPEKQGGAFLFSAIINQGERNADFAKVVPFSSPTDFTFGQLDQAKSLVFDRLLTSQGRLKEIGLTEFQSCGRLGRLSRKREKLRWWTPPWRDG